MRKSINKTISSNISLFVYKNKKKIQKVKPYFVEKTCKIPLRSKYKPIKKSK
jgi:hypothetical protein